MKTLYAVLLCLSMLFSGCAPKQQPKPSIQRKATHLILYTQDHQVHGACTGTIVGPHALMTAKHCDEGSFDAIRLDLAMHEYHIQKRWEDDHDHVVYGLDGDAFDDISVIKQRPAKEGEPVYFYGDPEAQYPPVLKEGYVEHNSDPSEITRKTGMHEYTMESIPGCSGSAVYAADGSMIGLITYHRPVPILFGLDTENHSVGFELNFTAKDLSEIAKFKPSKTKAKADQPPPPPILFPF